MKKLIYIEIMRLIRQPRIWITFGVFSIILILINVGMLLQGEDLLNILLQSLKNQFTVQGNILNGYFIAFISLNTLWVHIPVLLVIVTADLIASEFERGTIRNLLCSPVSRTNIVLAKSIVALFYILVFMLFTGIFMLVPSVIFFGKGDMLIFLEGLQVILANEAIPRFIMALAYGTYGMLCFASISIMLSVFLRNSIATVLASLGILIVSTLIQTFGFGIFETWKGFLFTYHMTQWQLFFIREIPFSEILGSMLVLSLYIMLALGITIFKFNRLQITE